MDLHAYTKSISDLFSVNKKYIVPRFQREYSWTKEEVLELFSDIVSNIIIDKTRVENQEYFIGSLVLVGEDNSIELSIVDGQQRLTTLTIFLSALVQIFKENNESNTALSLYDNYVEGKNEDFKPYFKLVNETPKPFFQRAIQHYDKEKIEPTTQEERTLIDAYEELYKRLKEENLKKDIKGYGLLKGATDKEKYFVALKGIRDQIVRYLKVIYITVKDEEDAYTIFETLNARGLNLTSIDLVKNSIFKSLNTQHPDDFAKTKWKEIKSNLSIGEEKINVETFFRHFWLSNYGFTSEGKIYKTFRKLVKENKLDINEFINNLINSSRLYSKIANPNPIDWKTIDEKEIYNYLCAFNVFKVTQVRPLLMALFELKENKTVPLSEIKKIVKCLEHFHFQFTAVCSSRASGLEGKYSRTARDLRNAKNIIEMRRVIKELIDFLDIKKPTEANFVANLIKLEYTKTKVKDKKIIQYVFKTIEHYLQPTEELEINAITLEHIKPQSGNSSNSNLGKIGNLIPLDKKLNNKAGDKKFSDKLAFLHKSQLFCVKEFIKKYGKLPTWNDSDIESRNEEIAKFLYKDVFRIK